MNRTQDVQGAQAKKVWGWGRGQCHQLKPRASAKASNPRLGLAVAAGFSLCFCCLIGVLALLMRAWWLPVRLASLVSCLLGERVPAASGQFFCTVVRAVARRGFSARRFVALAAAAGQALTLTRKAAAWAHGAEAVGHQRQQVCQALHAGAHQQFDQGVLETRHTLGEVDLPTQLARFVALLNDRLQQVVHQQRQVLQQLPGVKVLFHRRHAAAAEVIQAQGLLESAVVRFDAPAAVVEIGEHLHREGLPIQQRGQQNLAFSAGELDSDQAQFDQGGGINACLGAEQARLGVTGSEELCILDLTRLEKLFDLRVVATRQAHQEMPLLLLKQCEQPVPGIAAVKQRQAASGHLRKVQVGAIALADTGGHDQAVQGLTVHYVMERGQSGCRLLAVQTKEAAHGRLQRQMDSGAIHGEYP